MRLVFLYVSDSPSRKDFPIHGLSFEDATIILEGNTADSKLAKIRPFSQAINPSPSKPLILHPTYMVPIKFFRHISQLKLGPRLHDGQQEMYSVDICYNQEMSINVIFPVVWSIVLVKHLTESYDRWDKKSNW